MSRCGIVILAAGGSARMGTPKQSLEFSGSTLLLRATQTALDSMCRPIVVVLGANAEKFEPAVGNLPVRVVINDQWKSGIGTSIRAGISAIQSSEIDAAMIFLCDQPLITKAALDRMVATHFENLNPITSAFYANSLGTPAIFSSALFNELVTLQDGQGGKAIIQRYSQKVNSYPLPEAEMDVDTPGDFAKLPSHRQ